MQAQNLANLWALALCKGMMHFTHMRKSGALSYLSACHCAAASLQSVPSRCCRTGMERHHLTTPRTSADNILRHPLHRPLAPATSLRNLPHSHPELATLEGTTAAGPAKPASTGTSSNLFRECPEHMFRQHRPAARSAGCDGSNNTSRIKLSFDVRLVTSLRVRI